MERLNTNVGARDAALEQAPEVLKAISVNLPVDVLFGMVDNFVSVFLRESVIGLQGIGVQRGTRFDMLLNFNLKSSALPVRNDSSANLSAALQCFRTRWSCLCRQYQ